MQFPLLGRWEETETGEVLAGRLLVAKTFWQRFVGLQFSSPLAADCGLLLRGCRSIHTFWMRFAIDVIFLNDEMEVLEVRTGVAPWRTVIPRAKNVAHVIELTAGVARNSLDGRRTRTVPVPAATGHLLGEAR